MVSTVFRLTIDNNNVFIDSDAVNISPTIDTNILNENPREGNTIVKYERLLKNCGLVTISLLINCCVYHWFTYLEMDRDGKN